MTNKAVTRATITTPVDGLMVDGSLLGSAALVGLCWANAGRARSVRRMRRVVMIGF